VTQSRDAPENPWNQQNPPLQQKGENKRVARILESGREAQEDSARQQKGETISSRPVQEIGPKVACII
jgi:hypothetical protein